MSSTRCESRILLSFGDALDEERELADSLDEDEGFRMVDRWASGGEIPTWAISAAAGVVVPALAKKARPRRKR